MYFCSNHARLQTRQRRRCIEVQGCRPVRRRPRAHPRTRNRRRGQQRTQLQHWSCQRLTHQCRGINVHQAFRGNYTVPELVKHHSQPSECFDIHRKNKTVHLLGELLIARPKEEPIQMVPGHHAQHRDLGFQQMLIMRAQDQRLDPQIHAMKLPISLARTMHRDVAL